MAINPLSALEIEPLEFRVSTVSINQPAHHDRYFSSHSAPDYEGLDQTTREVNVLKATNGYVGQKIVNHEKRVFEFSQNVEVESNETRNLISQQMAKTAQCDTETPQLKQGDLDDNGGSVSEETDRAERALEQVDELMGFPSQQTSNPKECDIDHTRKEINDGGGFEEQQMVKPENCSSESELNNEENVEKNASSISRQKRRKFFYYESPLPEDTGVWIPVSVPPMSESDHEDWVRGFRSNGGYFPDGDMVLSQLTMWDVVVDMLIAAQGKVSAFASGDIDTIPWMSGHMIEQAWEEMAQTLTEANVGDMKNIIESEPAKWLPDSAACACMLCGIRFHPILCSRHHCRFCGGIFCGDCTKGRSLLPAKFCFENPQRVCDVCCVRLESVQPYLMDKVSRAAQLPTHDLTDLSTLRSWVNFPWGQSMEYEIFKATNTIRGYSKVGALRPEKLIPDAILRHAKGLAILTVIKVGMMVTYSIGTGLVVARREDGSWSPPSAISSFGVRWGAQAGGELTDFIIVLRTKDSVKTFSGDVHLSIGAGFSAAAGIIGRTVEADVRAGDGGYAACYSYSCSKGAFVGCSLGGSIITTRTRENCRFYGSQLINASDILLGSLPRPPAAAILYRALADLYQKFEAK